MPFVCLQSLFHSIFVSHELLDPFFEELGTIEHNLFSLAAQKINQVIKMQLKSMLCFLPTLLYYSLFIFYPTLYHL